MSGLDQFANPVLLGFEPGMEIDVIGTHRPAQDHRSVEVHCRAPVSPDSRWNRSTDRTCLAQRVIEAMGGLRAVIDQSNSHEKGDSNAADRMPSRHRIRRVSGVA